MSTLHGRFIPMLVLLESYRVNAATEDGSNDTGYIVAIAVLSTITLAAVIGLIVFGIMWNKNTNNNKTDERYVADKTMKKQIQMGESAPMASAGQRQRDIAYRQVHGKSRHH